jgi:hypothetical protein
VGYGQATEITAAPGTYVSVVTGTSNGPVCISWAARKSPRDALAAYLTDVSGDLNKAGEHVHLPAVRARGLRTLQPEQALHDPNQDDADHGKISESFLRGAGVPEDSVAYMKSLTGSAFEFYSVFISYSTKDQDFADRLHADLQAKGVRCWFAPHDVQGGRKLHEQIDEAIRVYDKLLLILSDHSMNSNWVKTEIANARAKEA